MWASGFYISSLWSFPSHPTQPFQSRRPSSFPTALPVPGSFTQRPTSPSSRLCRQRSGARPRSSSAPTRRASNRPRRRCAWAPRARTCGGYCGCWAWIRMSRSLKSWPRSQKMQVHGVGMMKKGKMVMFWGCWRIVGQLQDGDSLWIHMVVNHRMLPRNQAVAQP